MEREEYKLVRNQLIEDYCEYEYKIRNIEDDDYMETQSISPSMVYFRITGVNRTNNDETYCQYMNALCSLKIAFSYIIKVEQGEIALYLGCDENKIEILKGIAGRIFCVNMSDNIDYGMIFNREYDYGGIIVGDVKKRDDEKAENAIEKLVNLKMQDNYAVVIVCCPLSNAIANEYLGMWECLAAQLEQLVTRQTTIRDERESISFSDTNDVLVHFKTLADKNVKKYEKSVNQGLFNCSVKYYANDKNICDIIAGTFMADSQLEELPRPLNRYNFDCHFPCDDRALVTIKTISIGDKTFKFPVFSNLYTSDETAYFVRFPQTDQIGFYKCEIPYFEVSREAKKGLYIGEILKNNIPVGKYYVPFEDLNRHIFVPGMTGAGKTNTLNHILVQLDEMNIPWMCIEPAKAEYYALYRYGIDRLKVVAAGSRDNPLFINPFEPINKAVSLQMHIDSLYSALLSSFTWVSPLPYVLENCIYRVYEECGFDLERAENNSRLEKYPTIEALYAIIPTVVRDMGYEGRMEHDVISSLQSRISTLRRGTKGDILNVANSMNIEELFNCPVVIELEQIGDNDVKSFVMSLLMLLLREYRMSQADYQLEVKHFLVIEEAHRLLKNIAPSGNEVGDPKANGVQFFTDMISELRSKGQGFIIADQIPEQLAPAVLKNTNLKICHRLVSGTDGKIVGDATHASEDQIRYMCNLKRGEAEVFSEGDNGPKLVRIPNMAGMLQTERESIGRDEILSICRHKSEKIKIKQYGLSVPCSFCQEKSCDGGVMLADTDTYISRFKKNFSAEEFEELCIELACELKRAGNLKKINCVLGKLFLHAGIGSEKQYYYLKIARDIVK